jgi:hypothetical protein
MVRWLSAILGGGAGLARVLALEREIGHIVGFRGDHADRLDVYLSWEEARRAAGLGE